MKHIVIIALLAVPSSLFALDGGYAQNLQKAAVYHSIPDGTVGCEDPVAASIYPEMSKYGLSEKQQGDFLAKGRCYPTLPSTNWALVRTGDAGTVLMRLLDPVNGGSLTLYYEQSQMIDAAGKHPKRD